VAQKHLVEIARAMSHEFQVMIMDEPTAALSSHEVDELFRVVRRLAASGKAILFISHKFEEIFAIADRYTVFRDGASVGTGPIADVTQDELVSLMVGRPVAELFPKAQIAIGEPVLEVNGLCSDREFADVSFTLHRGEVLGFYGLVGAGRTEVMEALFGLRPIDRGVVRLHGAPVALSSPRAAIDRGVVYVPEDRHRNGAVLEMSVASNATLPSLPRLWLDEPAELAMTQRIVERLAIKCASTRQRVADLSGGNQQKVVIGKWLATRPEGIDVGSKAAVHGLISELVADGLSVLLVTSELPELLGVADRVVVMRKGRIVQTLERREFDARVIVAAATGNAAPAPEHARA
jgi:rhamnose transport system ATP-binding protein